MTVEAGSAPGAATEATDRSGERLATTDRKAEHIELAADPAMQRGDGGFDAWIFEHRALPGMALEEVDTSVDFLGRTVRAPILVSCMTGGTDEAAEINRNLATAAEACGLPMGVGSQRAVLEDAERGQGFDVRDFAPTVPILANLGAVQLNYGFGLAECRAAVSMVSADALVFHLNPLQEALQPEGQTDFRELLARMGEVAVRLDVPVIAKEVGCGISARVARDLLSVGIRIVDTAGWGGTSWARIEGERAGEPSLGEVFTDWGIPTPEAIRTVAAVGGVTVIGSGGLRSGVDVAKALALGAQMAGMAFPFLVAARDSTERVVEVMERRIRELRIAMFCAGARTVEQLRSLPLTRRC